MAQTKYSHRLEEVHDFKLILSISRFFFNWCIGVVDDGQKHVEENEENKHNVQNEVERSKYCVSRLKFIEVKVSKNDSQLSEPVVKIRSIYRYWT